MITKLLGSIAAGLAVLLSTSTLPAAEGEGQLGPMMFTAGTTWREFPSSRDWAYVTWFGTSPASIGGRTFAVYAKDGDINSTSPFRRVSISALQTDPRVIEPLLQRSVSIGDNLTALQQNMAALFGKFVPVGLDLPNQVAAVIQGVMADERRFGNLALLARAHPGMAMCLGMAHAESIGTGLTTFEIRQFDPSTQQDIAVVGRVSVQAGAPTVLPPPGAPVPIPAVATRGNLNTQLRWAVPDPLRRLMLLQHGFNLYRVRQDFAEAPGRNWHLTPPTPATLLSFLGATTAVLRINHVPILTSKTFSPADVGNFDPVTGDPNTIFTIDDNDRERPGFPPPSLDYTNGARFYYFVTARDLLGRDGLVSPGTLVTICDRLMPDALTKVRVVNDYVFVGNTPQQHLRVIWQQASNTPASDETITRYWIYRWTNSHQIATNLQFSSNNLAAIVAHIPGAYENSYLDSGPGAPSVPAQLSKTYWYTVRAEDSGACGGNLSPHSPAVPGVLRDREGPEPPTGVIRTRCLSPVAAVSAWKTNQNAGTPGELDFIIHLVRESDKISWLDVDVEIRNGTNVLKTLTSGPLHFQPAVSSNRWVFTLPAQYQSQDIWVRARAGSSDGQVSGYPLVVGQIGKAQEDTELEFMARGFMADRRQGNCDFHVPIDPGNSNSITPVEVEVLPTPGSREYRLYRRVDDGPLSLICQKTWPATNPPPFILCFDFSFPAGAARICYYGQLFDQHGNASPLKPLGCIKVASPLPLPKPMLAPIDPMGTEATPQMRLQWFCPPVGVKRFQIGIAAPVQPGDNPVQELVFTGEIESHVLPKTLNFLPIFTSNQESNSAPPAAGQFKSFNTPAIGNDSSFGNGPQFILPVNISKGVHYAVWVRALSANGEKGQKSNLETFHWAPPITTPLPTVAWPARPLPPVGNQFGFNFVASWQTNILNRFTGAVVRISYFETNVVAGPTGANWPPATSDFAARPQVLKATSDPLAYLPLNAKSEPLFPLVLYRHQVPNGKFSTVSGDILQVSPMMESIAFERTISNSVVNAVIRDPFIIYDGISIPLGNGSYNLLATYLRDTQPVLAGARYRYLMVRFGRDGEIAEVIPTNEMEVP